MQFPSNTEGRINCISLTPQFLIMVDSNSKIIFFMIEEAQIVREFRFESPITSVYPNFSGTRVIAVDVTGSGFLYSPVNDVCLSIPNFSSKCRKVIFDKTDHNFFVTVELEKVLGYLYCPVTLFGAVVEPVRELLSVEDLNNELREAVTIVEKGNRPLIVCNGILFCHSENQGTIRGNFLTSHSYLNQWRGRSDTSEGHYRYFLQNLVLRRYTQCY